MDPSDRLPSAVSLAAAVVPYDAKVLTVRRGYPEGFPPGTWGVPCGKPAPGENPGAAVPRELFEETGLTGEVVTGAGERGFDGERDGRTVHNHRTNFPVHPLTLDVVLPEPDQEYRPVPVDRVDDAQLDAHNLGTIRQALAVLR
jgi:8-oxo-dGTP pyrophosphatase MutT (NUDIX family)